MRRLLLTGVMHPERGKVGEAGEHQAEKAVRGSGRGSRFFALGRPVWERLWKIQTSNRLNFVLAYMVLLAGTGSDHRLSKWSTKACEEHLGIGKPRAKRAIEELIAAGLVSRTAESAPLKPQYELPELSRDEDPIFLPVQIVTGLGGATPILRRVRETGDTLLLRMLVDLYGMLQVDATYGVPLSNLCQSGDAQSEKIGECGAHALWALTLNASLKAQGSWAGIHREKASTPEAEWVAFWERVRTLKKIGAIWYEPWVFDGEEADAEPLFPVDLGSEYAQDPDAVTLLTTAARQAAYALAGERDYLFERGSADFYLPLPNHHRAPALRGVAKLTVEPDTPGRRMAFGRRMKLVEERTALMRQIVNDAQAGRFDRPALVTKMQEVT